MIVLTVANQKGGVGKTTTVRNLGAAFQRINPKHRLLFIDSDPQANLSSYLGLDPDGPTLDELYLAKKIPAPGELIRSVEPGVSAIASSGALSGVEYYLFSRSNKESVLREFLKQVAHDFDTVIIDTPPSLNLLTWNALVAATGVVTPVQPEFFGLEGIVKLREALDQVRARWNPDVRWLGVLPTQVVSRRKLTEEVMTTLREALGDLVFESRIHETAAVSESTGHGQSIFEYDRTSRGSEDYLAAARELLTRVEGIPTYE